jgi:2-methylisocitrate lyase-like PEP mutase family enzyme
VKSHPPTAGEIIDCYRADAAEREAKLRTLEKENRRLLLINEINAKAAALTRDHHDVGFLAGGLTGYGVCGFLLAATDPSVPALIAFSALVVVGLALYAVMRLASRRATLS